MPRVTPKGFSNGARWCFRSVDVVVKTKETTRTMLMKFSILAADWRYFGFLQDCQIKDIYFPNIGTAISSSLFSNKTELVSKGSCSSKRNQCWALGIIQKDKEAVHSRWKKIILQLTWCFFKCRINGWWFSLSGSLLNLDF
jgi:hypothetical protein